MARLTVPLIVLLAGSVSAFAASDSGLLSLLPGDAQIVASMDVNASRASTFGQFMLRQMSVNDKSLQEMVQQTGFDPRRDLQTFVFAAMPSLPAQKHGRFVVLARGIFDQAVITSHATAKGLNTETFGGLTVLVSNDGMATALAFPETGIAVFGDRTSVEQVITNRSNPTTLNPDLEAQIAAGSANNDAWFASTLSGNELVGHVPSGVGPTGASQQGSQVMQGVLQSSGGIRFGSTVQLTFNARTRSDKDATSLTDLIRFLSSVVQMQRQNDSSAALLAPAIDGMQLHADGRRVTTSIAIPEADLERMMAASPVQAHSKVARRGRPVQ